MEPKKELTLEQLMQWRADRIVQTRHLPMAMLVLRQAGMRIVQIDTSFLRD